MKKSLYLLILMGIAPVLLWSQTEEKTSGALDWVYDNLLVILSLVVILAATIAIIRLVTNLLSFNRDKISNLDDKKSFEEKTFLDKMYDRAWAIVPMGKESTIDLGHDYDGIRELDNRLPPWWLALMYGTIAFAGIYLYIYHWSGSGWSSEKEYQEQMAQGEEIKQAYLARMANQVNENNVELLTDAAEIAAGREVFESYTCQTCHGQVGEGNAIGPNLTDQYWLHGGGIKNIFTTIKYGVPEKGMISWKEQLTPSQIQSVGSYIVSLQGSNPPNGKDPQGEIWNE